MESLPRLLFWCQHALGMGHLVRSFALARRLSKHFRVTLLNGGRLPSVPAPPSEIDVVSLPPLAFDKQGKLQSLEPGLDVVQASHQRRETILATYRGQRPDAVVIELFPFGRKQFAPELFPLLDEARFDARRPFVCASVRDLLVDRGERQRRQDDFATYVANSSFDAVLVHSDPDFARFEESFSPSTPLRVPLQYTGFVHEIQGAARPLDEPGRVIVSAGGGAVGGELLRAAAEAHKRLGEGWATTLIAGPLLPEDEWRDLRRRVEGVVGLRARRSVPSLVAEMRQARVSVSQGGYNTTLDVLRSGARALIVPFDSGPENEQMRRAQRLEQMGALRTLDPRDADGASLAQAIRDCDRFAPAAAGVSLEGATVAADWVADRVRDQGTK